MSSLDEGGGSSLSGCRRCCSVGDCTGRGSVVRHDARDTSRWSQAGLREARHCAAARRAVVFRQAGTFLEDAVEE